MTKTSNLLKVSYAPLDAGERKKLKKGFYFIPFFVLFAGGVIYFMLSMSVGGDDFFTYGIIGMAVFFGLLIFWIVRGIVLDLKDNEKKVLQGLITVKQTNRSTGGKRNRRSYYFYFGDKRMRVEPHLYHKFEEGDLIEIHQAKRVYNVIFKSELLKRGALPEEVEQSKTALLQKQKKQGRYIIIGFLIAVPILLCIVFGFIADCWVCSVEYPDSITEWRHYQPDKSVKGMAAVAGEEILALCNEGLLDSEEARIDEMLFNLASEHQLNNLILYLGAKRLESDGKTAIDWLRIKFDEQNRVKRPISVIEIWKRVLYNVIPIEAMKPSYLYQLNKTKYQDVTGRVIQDSAISYESVKTWFGRELGVDELQRGLVDFIPANADHYNADVQRFMKEIWSAGFQMNERFQKDYDRARKVFNIN